MGSSAWDFPEVKDGGTVTPLATVGGSRGWQMEIIRMEGQQEMTRWVTAIAPKHADLSSIS